MEPFYGPDDVPKSELLWLNQQFVVQRLQQDDQPFLPLIPRNPPDELPLAALQWPFQWGEDSPTITCLCTAGLAAFSQDTARPFTHRHLELAFMLQSPGFSAEFVERFLALARGLGRLLEGGQAFAVGDWIESAPLLDGFEAAILGPPFPELLASSLCSEEPTEHSWETVDVPPEHWWDPRLLVREGSRGFLQLCPITADECAEVSASGEGLRYLLTRLVPEDGALDVSHWITDPARRPVTDS